MTTRKHKTKRADLEARAREIIADVRAYDYDTRLTLARAVADEALPADTLAGMLAQADAGEIVEAPGYSVGEDFHGAGHAAVRFMDNEALPSWLLDAVMTAINAAARAQRILVWLQFPGELEPDEGSDGVGYSARALGELFRVSEPFKLDLIPRPTLAEHIAAVLADEQTPERIYNPLSEAVVDLTSRNDVSESAEVIRIALDAAEKGGD
jgi:hypothetical protein